MINSYNFSICECQCFLQEEKKTKEINKYGYSGRLYPKKYEYVSIK